MRHRNVLKLLLMMVLAPATAWATATIDGRVTTDGAGIPGASVFLGDREVRTDNDGNYTILDAPAGGEPQHRANRRARAEASIAWQRTRTQSPGQERN